MLHKNLKVLKRSISEKLLKRAPSSQKLEAAASITDRQCASSSQSSQDEEDPYREILRMYNDNVSHLVLYGSSLKSMSSIDFQSMHQPEHRASSCHVHFDESTEVVNGRSKKAVNA
ncbi:unnamed protein product [Cylicocyclus nassatus]|uniref:Uncharacterized protein n=1 Tax=Cylicocyclus nassatus TaxID=53992 RepID=A0AA36HA85_CYLNA|nr:unnamed protein product [Cylicocyclus nassatus]